MPDSLCRLTVAACSDDAHCAVDLALPTDMDIGQLMPQIVDIVHRDKVLPVTGRRWRLSRLGDSPLDESMTLNDSSIHDGEVLLLTAVEPSSPEWVSLRSEPRPGSTWFRWRRAAPADGPADLLRASRRTRCGNARVVGSAYRVGCPDHHRHMHCRRCGCWRRRGSAAPAARRPAESGRRDLHRGSRFPCSAARPTRNRSAARIRRRVLRDDPPAAPDRLRPNMFDDDRDRERADRGRRRRGRDVEAAAERRPARHSPRCRWRPWVSHPGCRWRSAASARRRSTIDDADAGFTHRTLSGLICGASVAASLGAASVALGQLRDPGSTLRDTTFTAVIALILLLRVRTHADDIRCIGLAVSAIVAAAAGFAAAAVSAPGQAHVIGALAAAAGTAALGCLLGLTISPIVARAIEVVEYLALAAVVPLACWVGGIFGLVRGLGLT